MSEGQSHLPEGPPIVPGMGPPVFRAEAHGDLEHLRVHHVGDHSQEACGGQRRSQEAKGALYTPRARPPPSLGRTVTVNRL